MTDIEQTFCPKAHTQRLEKQLPTASALGEFRATEAIKAIKEQLLRPNDNPSDDRDGTDTTDHI